MGKDRFYDSHVSPFKQRWSNPKHSFSQVNGETMQTQHNYILQQETRKQS